jgi:signal transduction histidine kinase
MTISAEFVGESVSLGDRSLKEQVFRLYENAPIGFAATLVNSSILVGILRNDIDTDVLALWWSSLVVLTVARTIHFEWFRRVAAKRELDAERWTGSFVAGIFAAGLIWGSAGIWLLPASVPHQTFVAFVLGGMVAGAAATFSVRMDAFLAFAIPALLPAAIHLCLFGDELRVAMGAMMFLFGLLLTWTAYRVNRLISRTLELDGEIESVRASAFDETGELAARLRESEQARIEVERKLGDRGDDVEERLRQCVSDMADTFVTLLEKSECRLETHWLRRVEQARLEASVGFAQGVAYRMYEALRSVSDQLRLLVVRPPSNGWRLAPESLQPAEAAIESAEELVDDLVLYANHDVEDACPVDVSALLGSVVEQWKRMISDDVLIWSGASESPSLVRGSARTLRWTIHQLIANACEAVGQRGGTVEVRVRTVASDEVPGGANAVGHDALPAGPVALIEIVDDGEGMSRQSVERIFVPFFSTRSRGRGLGMAIVASVVRRHGGRILVDSYPLRGTRVRVFLPATEAPLAPHVH